MADMKQPTFVTVDGLRPLAKNVNVTVQVCCSGRPLRKLFSFLTDSHKKPGHRTGSACTGADAFSAPQVIETKTVVDRAARGPKGAALKVSECLVGDSTGVIIFSARNEQGACRGPPTDLAHLSSRSSTNQRPPSPTVPAVDVAQKGAYVTLRNAKVDMYRGSMRLAVDQFGKVEAAEGQSFKPKVSLCPLPWPCLAPRLYLLHACFSSPAERAGRRSVHAQRLAQTTRQCVLSPTRAHCLTLCYLCAPCVRSTLLTVGGQQPVAGGVRARAHRRRAQGGGVNVSSAKQQQRCTRYTVTRPARRRSNSDT